MGDKAAIDATGLLPIPHSHRWDILADGLDPIIESMEGFDKALFARVKSLKWLHHSSHSLGGLFADVWSKTIKLDTGRVQRREAVRVWFQQRDLAAVASEVDERRRNLIESLKTWQDQARPTVEWNENTISVLKQIPNSGGIDWPESQQPELIDYLGEDHADSLSGICGKVAELVTYLKMQRGTVARRLAESQQPEKTIPPAAPSSEGTRITWQQAKVDAETHLARNPWPGLNALSLLIGCSPSTMSKARDNSPTMREKEAAYWAGKQPRTPRQLMASQRDGLAGDDDVSETVAVDELFSRIINMAETPEKRAILENMTPEKRRDYVALIECDPDGEGVFDQKRPAVRERSRTNKR